MAKKLQWTNILDILEDVRYYIDLLDDIFDDENWDAEKEMIIDKIMSKWNAAIVPDFMERQIYGWVLDIVRDSVRKRIERENDDK